MKYLEAVKLEQSLASITPKHAVPLFVDKLIKVSRLIDYNLYNPKLSVYQKYTCVFTFGIKLSVISCLSLEIELETLVQY
jgi:hypothetical protein